MSLQRNGPYAREQQDTLQPSLPRRTSRLFTATGFNKWGMTGAMLSAMLLSDMIQGKKKEYADIFSPSRSIMKPQLLVNGFEAVTNLLKFNGKRCPHMGCVLQWNSAEH